SGPRCQDTILGDVDAQTRFEITFKQSNDPPLSRGYTLGSGEDNMKLLELMAHCTKLSELEGVMDITATIYRKVKLLVTEASLRRHLNLEDSEGLNTLPTAEIFEQLALMGRARRSFKVVLSDDEEEAEDPSKQGNKISNIDKDPTISLVQEEGMAWSQKDLEIQEKISDDTEVVLEEEEPTELVKDQEPEPEPEQTTTKLKLRQERAGLEAAIRLQEQLNEEESQRITRDAEIARQLQEEINIAGQEKVVTKDDQSHDINWNDPSMIRFYAQQNRPYSKDEVRKNMYMYLKNQGGYKMSYFKGMSYEDIRPIFERVWDQNHAFVPKDSEIEKEVMKRPGFDLQQDNSKR
ncbi:hypothetical protein Tco_0479477, partial [Tanacetum coccineum]